MHSRLVVGLLAVAMFSKIAYAEAFDDYTAPVIAEAVMAGKWKELEELTGEAMIDAAGVVPKTTGAMLIVRTNEFRWAKLLVQPGRQRFGKEVVPTISIEKYVTIRELTEKAIQAQGQTLALFDQFHFSLDLGQVVPSHLGGDLKVVADEQGNLRLKTIGMAKMYLVTEHLKLNTDKKAEKFVIGDPFEPKYFNGKFKLYDDGRRSGLLTLKVEESGVVRGAFYSDKDNQKYEVSGKVKSPSHAIQFTIYLPRTEQVYDGMMFTGTGLAITGFSKLQNREAGFYALRITDE